MKKVLDILFSSKVTLILLLIFALGSAIATFVEDKLDTLSAYKFVYGATWFELLMILLVLNFIGNIRKYNLLSKQRLFGFMFHAAFILMILGAGITRYIGFGGTIHIREKNASNILYSSETFLQVKSEKNPQFETRYFPLSYADMAGSFNYKFDLGNNSEANVSFVEFIPNAIEGVIENATGGTDILELRVVRNNIVDVVRIKSGEIKNVGKFDLAFNNDQDPKAIHVFDKGGVLNIQSSYDIIKTTMQQTDPDAILKDSTKEFKVQHIYKTDGVLFAFSRFYKKAVFKWIHGKETDKGSRVLVVNVSQNGKNQEVPLFCNSPSQNLFQDLTIGNAQILIGWGQKEIKLPFAIYLDDFILDRYPGSTNPSSYRSEVTVVDSVKNTTEKHSIFMNNVLDYNGYRFFQSSYDLDEKGTILSVSHDFWGTWISYLGYFLICVGAFLTLLNKNSRFGALRQSIKKMRLDKKAGVITIFLLLCCSGSGFSQTHKAISEEHADKLGHLLVQTYDGRFEPMHTLAMDVMHKISRKDNFTLEGKGKLNGMQAFWDMFLDPEYWKNQKIIYVREKAVQSALGIEGNASYNEMFDAQHMYKLASVAQSSFMKKPTEQNAFDKEILKLNERVNICRMVFEGKMLKIFPEDDSPTNKWIDPYDSLAMKKLSGSYNGINQDLRLPVFNFNNMFQLYVQNVFQALQSGDYSAADKIIGYIESMQRQSNAGNIIPTVSQVKLEIFYNNAKIFEILRNIYGIISLILLSLAFYENRSAKKNKKVTLAINAFIGLLGIAFLYHTFGLCLRWYLSGHAPWSNGYEALLLVAWGGLLAGFFFLRYSKITLASTALLGFSILMTAGHSSYDPQLTNLQPVLKSYWLIIHVAAITVSYGFLGLGFMLGIINMLLYVSRNNNNAIRVNPLITELTKINEMNLEIGLFLATIGTFLGGVWANESWGRYWGWDAKETWALIIVLVYAIVLHLRLVPKLKSEYVFNVSSIIGFGSVIMTFVGVNYYLSKGMHSYGTSDTPVFPIWAWIMIGAVVVLMIWAWIKSIKTESQDKDD